jgi:uncharacterized membrane protein YcfT
MPWIDATRGAAVAAVVLFHVCIWHFLPILRADGQSPVALRFWSLTNGVIGGLRMPVLLTLSGMLVARRVSAGFGRTRRTAAANLYLYLVWVAVYAVVSLVVPQHMPQEITSAGDAVKQVLVPETTLWYVYALALYGVVLTALRRLPSWSVLAPLAVLNVLAFTYPPGVGFWGKILGLAVYFAIGVRCGSVFRSSVVHVTAWRTTLLVVLSAALIYCDRFAPNRVAEVTFTLLRNVVIVFMAVAVVALLVRLRPFERLGVYLGQRTLGVYVLHALLVQLLYVAGGGPLAPGVRWAAGHELPALLYPVVVTVLLILACVGLETLLRRAGAGWLFLLPAPLRDRLEPPTGTDGAAPAPVHPGRAA